MTKSTIAAEEAARETFAESTLQHFERVSALAERELAQGPPAGAGAFASVNSFTSDAVDNLTTIGRDERENWSRLRSEPAIARLLVRDEEDHEQTIYITRGSTPSSAPNNPKIASYRSPLGRLATLPAGSEEEIWLPGGAKAFLIVETAGLRPIEGQHGWDAKDSVWAREGSIPLTIPSLRRLLESRNLPAEAEDLLDSFLRGDGLEEFVIQGIRRTVIDRMGLRDRTTLDRYQDEIFRLPLSTHLAILGPPGSGKTTTLIKRLGQKLDWAHLDIDEREAVQRSRAGERHHARSWLMLTPSELLRLYVKEAFAREQIPAPDEHIRTWDDQRRELGRERLGILKTHTGGGFVMREDLDSIRAETIEKLIPWYEDFDAWQVAEFRRDLAVHADRLATSGDPQTRRLGQVLRAHAEDPATTLDPSTLVDMLDASASAKSQTEQLREKIKHRLRGALTEEARRDSSLLVNLMEFISTLSNNKDIEEDLDDPEVDDDEATTPSANNRERAFAAYGKAVRARARLLVTGRNVGKKSRDGRILEWLGTRIPSEEDLRDIGGLVSVLDSLRPFENPVRRYLNRIPHRYRGFRRQRQADGLWYTETLPPVGDLHPLEVDLIILAMLRAGSAMLADRRIRHMVDEPRYGTLQAIREMRRNQIVVDEATDFSPVQLACMAEMSDPAIGAFVACGDFNQRLTLWGSRSSADLEWAIPEIDVRSITVTYRHSRQLNDFAQRIIELDGGVASPSRLPEHLISEGHDPVMGVFLQDGALADWLAQRIGEIQVLEKGVLPSIAVLMNGEKKLGALSDMLNERLREQTIKCVACPGGRVKGLDNEVRVFDVRYIKGLEFEAVFFVDIDELLRDNEDLFQRYLYVGATRAATYLGLTCHHEKISPKIHQIRDLCSESWL